MTDDPSATGTAARHQEVELKYRVLDVAAAERLLRAEKIGDLGGGLQSMRTTQMEDRYVDTADGALTRAGFTVRLRQHGNATLVTVKSNAHTNGPGGAVRRDELEGPADRVAPAVDWSTSDARALVLEHAGDAPLIELVTVRQLRRKRVLKATDGRVELSLDEVDVVARGRVVERFVELEAEMVKGDEDVLEGLAALLDAEPAFRRSDVSKFEAAMAAVRGKADDGADEHEVRRRPARPPKSKRASRSTTRIEPVRDDAADAPSTSTRSTDSTERPAPDPKKAVETTESTEATGSTETTGSTDAAETIHLSVGKTPGVTADDHLAEAGRKVIRFHLARMLDYEAGTRSGAETEDLHKMRVATRRQRAAWRVFGAAFRTGRTRRYRRGLREIAGRLGAVRDLDVLLEAADAYRADLPVSEQRALEPLLSAWREHRDDARVLLVRELDSDGYRRWLDDYRDFVRTEGALVMPVGPVEPHRVRDTMPSRIWTAYEGVRGYEPVLRWADIETLHDLRIAGKWLRYTIEFVREALGPESGVLIARVTALQDHLGLMHDADVSASMARTYLVEHGTELSQLETGAIGRYLMDREKTAARLRRTAGAPWRGIAGVRFRRGLGRVIADL